MMICEVGFALKKILTPRSGQGGKPREPRAGKRRCQKHNSATVSRPNSAFGMSRIAAATITQQLVLSAGVLSIVGVCLAYDERLLRYIEASRPTDDQPLADLYS